MGLRKTSTQTRKAATGAREPSSDGATASRDLILDAAASLFAERGYDGTGIAEIAKAVGLGKSSIYHHFRDKDEIFSSISLATLEGICKHVEDRVRDIADPAEKLLAFMVGHADYFDRHRGRYIATQFAFLRMTDEPKRAAALRFRDRYESGLRSILAEGTASGIFSVPDASLATRLILAALNSLARWHQPRGPMSATDVASGLYDLLMEGFRPRRGRD